MSRRRYMKTSNILLGFGTLALAFLAKMIARKSMQEITVAGGNKIVGIVDGAVDAIDRTKNELNKIVKDFMARNEPSTKEKIENAAENIEEMAKAELAQLKEKIAYLEEQLSNIKDRV